MGDDLLTTDIVCARVGPAIRLLTEARTAGDAKRVADMARAAEVYGKRQHMADEAIAQATAVKVDALALMGEFLRSTEKATAGRPPKIGSQREPIFSPPTLAEVGITKKESAIAQALATIRDENPVNFEAFRSGDVPVSRAPTIARGEHPQVRPASKLAPGKPAAPTDRAWQEFVAKLADVAAFAANITPTNVPGEIETWPLTKTLMSSARALMAASTRLVSSRR